ncbi:MAG: hypothetical protein BGO27_04120 [Alphaproteobacteria bacterium 33-17]|nr:MAG: hypothetical protein BGO27_04120 [Alphaproteobacteria bacterium 33-17]
MRVVVCGAGLVGSSIANYLSENGHEVSVIDTNPEVVNNLNIYHDIRAIVGHSCHPDVLEQAGMSKADAIVAVTVSDEINMLTCHEAYSLFSTPLKIARVRSQSYLDPKYSELFAPGGIFVDHIISPEAEVAKAFFDHIRITGVEKIISFCDNLLKVISFNIGEGARIMSVDINDYIVTDHYKILGIQRGTQYIFGENIKNVELGDKLFIAVVASYAEDVCYLSGIDNNIENIVIIGGGNIGYTIAKMVEDSPIKRNLQVIELSEKRAHDLASHLEKTVVINGSAIDRSILNEVEIDNADVLLSVTNDDKVNILAALLAKQRGVPNVIALINEIDTYADLAINLGIDHIVNPRAITINNIIKNFSLEKVSALHEELEIKSEIIEIEVMEDSKIIGQNVFDIDKIDYLEIGAIYRNGEVLIPDHKDIIMAYDKIVVMLKSSHYNDVVNMFRK